MRYSHEFVWEMVGVICPGFKAARENGVSMNLPSCLSHCAVTILIEDYDASVMPWSYAKMVVQEALRELHSVGWMEFGEVNEMWK